MARRDFLFELGCEELPSAAVLGLSVALAEALTRQFSEAGIRHGAVQPYGTPRRLAVLIRGVSETAADTQVARRGPPVSAAFDASGQPTRAALAFAESCGVPLESLGRIQEAKGEFLHYAATRPGAATVSLLEAMVNTAIAGLPVAKRMRWGAGEVEFARPVHWVVMLYGHEVVPATVLGIAAGRTTYGHRFMAPKPIALATPAGYAARLEKRGQVIADFARRRDMVRDGVAALAAAEGGRAVMSEALLEEVTALVEWPVPVAAGFDARFLELPDEVLVSTLEGHQRYFAIRDAGGRLRNRFVTVANLVSRDPAQVAAGNERVVRPRLADAAFFWNQDRATPLAARIEALGRVTFQADLGSYRDKAERTAVIARHLAPLFGVAEGDAGRVALLAKCDLLTGLVGEFPDLQGTMGGYYALADGEPAEIATAIAGQYQPRFAGDALPAGPLGQVLSVADKLDTIAGIFAIGQKPSGTRDPFALRRAALGVLRILIEARRPVDLIAVLGLAVGQVVEARDRLAAGRPAKQPPAAAATVVAEVYDYLFERLRAYYVEAGRGITTEMFDAVLDRRPASPLDFDARVRALAEFLTLDAAPALAAANKRIANILKKSDESGRAEHRVEAALLAEPAERSLYEALGGIRGEVRSALADGDYTAAMRRLAGLRGAVDGFFDSVLVNAPEPALRANRLALLAELRSLFLATADLSRLPG
jgi:glycyl-tRNA synthetase beta chain